MKVRFKLSCGHWTVVLDEATALHVRALPSWPVIPCRKCDRSGATLVEVVKMRQLKDTARVGPGARAQAQLDRGDAHRKREAAALRRELPGHDYKSRHWKVPE